VILSKFWSRYDLQNFRKLNFLGDDQGELSKGTVYYSLNLQLRTSKCVHTVRSGQRIARVSGVSVDDPISLFT
jgi:hypothetical protein